MNTSHTRPSPKKSLTSYFNEESSFKLVSTLMTELLADNFQQIHIVAKSGNFTHDQSAGFLCPDITHVATKNISLTGKGNDTEISIEGSIKKDNGNSNKFSVFLFINRTDITASTPFKTVDNDIVTGINLIIFHSTVMLYNSIFTLSIVGVDNVGNKSPLGTCRGYLIFDEEQQT